MNTTVKKIVYIIVLSLIGFIIWYIAIPYIKNLQSDTLQQRIDIESYSDNPQSIEVFVGTSTVTVDLAITATEKEIGLGGVRDLKEDEGMLFIFDKRSYPAIWMKGMIIPIDIVWLDENFIIIHTEENVSPSTYPKSFKPVLPAKYVLEVNAGYLSRHGVTVGEKITLVPKDKI